MKQNKLITSLENSLWQSMPLLSTFLLSFLIVRWFSITIWGSIVAVLVIQQLVNGVLAWGNKDYLQRELGADPTAFSQLFLERFLLFIVIIPVAFFSGFVSTDVFIAFVLLVFFRFFIQSFDVLITIERKFKGLIVLDICLLLFQVTFLYLKKNEHPDLNGLLLLFWLPQLFKSLLLLFVFRKSFKKPHFKKVVILNSFFFAMLTITGLVHSKVDVFLVGQLLDKKTLGEYQIIMAFLWSIQSISMYVSGPFIHNFYRMNPASQKKSGTLLKNIGFLIVPVAVGIVMLLLHYLFTIPVNASIITASLFFSIASFIYLPWVLQINHKRSEHRMLLINCIGSIVLFGLIYLTNCWFGLSLERILWIIAGQQLLIILFVYTANTSPKHA